VTIKSIINWNVELCGLVEACLLSDERTASTLTTEALCSFESSVNIYKATQRHVPAVGTSPVEQLLTGMPALPIRQMKGIIYLQSWLLFRSLKNCY
jgi:hypothetical protein